MRLTVRAAFDGLTGAQWAALPADAGEHDVPPAAFTLEAHALRGIPPR
jgi:hypothetical protein